MSPLTYDVTTEIGQVRLLTNNRALMETDFDDGEIQAFLTLEGTVRRAAALALETIAADEARILKVIVMGNLRTNGRDTATALRDGAALLREQDAMFDGTFETAEQVATPWAARERWLKQSLRGRLP